MCLLPYQHSSVSINIEIIIEDILFLINLKLDIWLTDSLTDINNMLPLLVVLESLNLAQFSFLQNSSTSE